MWKRRERVTPFDPQAGEVPEHLGLQDAGAPSAKWLLVLLAGVGLVLGARVIWDELTGPGEGQDDAAVARSR
jgi:hypothetical protein